MKLGQEYYGEFIRDLTQSDKSVFLRFDEGMLELVDAGQSCCEKRYFKTEDDLSDLIGERLVRIELVGAAGSSTGVDEDDVLDWTFLKITTDRQQVSITAYNSHNGYYAGFDITAVSWHNGKPNG